MPPKQFSRHTFTTSTTDDDDLSYLTDRIPFRYKAFNDNRKVVVQQGDTLYTLAGKYFQPLDRPAGLWWVIADFQPTPIHDPTIQLAAGTTIVIPSVRTVIERIFNEERRRETEV